MKVARTPKNKQGRLKTAALRRRDSGPPIVVSVAPLSSKRINRVGPLAIVIKIEKGLPQSEIRRVAHKLGVEPREVCKILDLGPTSARRRLTPEQSDRIVRLERICDQALAHFDGHAEAALAWLSRPALALSARIPLSLLRTDAGAREVERLLHQLEYGIYP